MSWCEKTDLHFHLRLQCITRSSFHCSILNTISRNTFTATDNAAIAGMQTVCAATLR
jgi:hypothetical protein